MEIKEIEQRIEDAVSEIPLKEILQESKDKLKVKLERFEKNSSLRKGHNWRLKARNLHKAKNRGYKCFSLCRKCIRVGILIMLGFVVYQLMIQKFFN